MGDEDVGNLESSPYGRAGVVLSSISSSPVCLNLGVGVGVSVGVDVRRSVEKDRAQLLCGRNGEELLVRESLLAGVGVVVIFMVGVEVRSTLLLLLLMPYGYVGVSVSLGVGEGGTDSSSLYGRECTTLWIYVGVGVTVSNLSSRGMETEGVRLLNPVYVGVRDE